MVERSRRSAASLRRSVVNERRARTEASAPVAGSARHVVDDRLASLTLLTEHVARDVALAIARDAPLPAHDDSPTSEASSSG